MEVDGEWDIFVWFVFVNDWVVDGILFPLINPDGVRDGAGDDWSLLAIKIKQSLINIYINIYIKFINIF